MQFERLSHGFTLHLLAVAFGLLLYVLSARARRERRPPASAVAWVLGIVALPYVVVPAYLVFGARKMPRPGARRRCVLPEGAHWAERLIVSFGLAPATSATVRFHRDGAEAMQAWRDVVQAAERRLEVATLIVGDDAIGCDMLALLTERVRAGVEVRLLLDGMGALQAPKAALRALRAAGGNVRIFSPFWRLGSRTGKNLRNHRKFTIADRRTLWSGGRNLAAEYFVDTPAGPAWRDLSFEATGPIASEAARQFEADWVASGGKQGGPANAVETAVKPAHPDESRVQFLPSGPDQEEDTIQAVLIDACYRAERRIIAATPYFVPGDGLEMALRLAARRGVRVSLFMPLKSNHSLADWARRRPLRALAEAGVDVQFVPYMMHAKAFVVDDSMALCGSTNLDLRSLLVNHEASCVFFSAQDVRWLATWMEALRADATAFVPVPPTFAQDLAEGLLLTLAFQL
ncbi:MAG: phospholipase D-like domain-containing protein [Myxococcales bacterium]